MAVRFGGRVRKGIAVAAVAAAAMVALTASQAPGLVVGAAHRSTTVPTPPPGTQIDGGSPYIVNLPPLGSIGQPSGPATPGTPLVTGGAGSIPTTVLLAYQRAEAMLRGGNPDCHLPWQLLAGIGQVESGQAENGNVDADGNTRRPILGPVLDGGRFADITDTDGGRYDGDPVHDRAVGPMQFIPSTWAKWGADGNHDGVKNPENVFDAALAAGDYLCAVGGDLSQPANMARAILGYNHSQAYLKTVESWYEYFLKGVHEVPNSSLGSGVTAPTPTASASPSSKPSSRPSGHPLPTVSASGSIGPVPSGSDSPSGPPSTDPTGGGGSPSSPTCPTDPPSDPTGSQSPSDPPSSSASGSPSPSQSPGDPCASPSPSASATTPVPSTTG